MSFEEIPVADWARAFAILEFEIARLLRVNTDGFRLVTDRFHLINPVSGSERLASSVVSDERGYAASEFETDGTLWQVVITEPVLLR